MNHQILDSTVDRRVKTWPVMIELSTYPGHQSQPGRHEEETRADVLTLHIILENGVARPNAEFCQAMDDLLKKGKSDSRRVPDEALRELMMIAHCLHVGGYEVVAYEFTSRLADQGGTAPMAEDISDMLKGHAAATRERPLIQQGAHENQLIADPLTLTGNNRRQ